MNLMKSYLKTVIAKISGDKAADVAERNYRKSHAAVNSQLANQASSRVELEEDLANAKEALENAKYPATPITDGKVYIQGILNAQASVVEIEEELAAIDELTAYLKGLQAEFDNEVSDETAA